MFTPWILQTGHQTEWTKLLLILYQYQSEAWMVERTEFLFNAAMKYGCYDKFNDLIYGFAPGGQPCDTDKHFWIQAESFAAAAYLAKLTRYNQYWQDYKKIWQC